MSLWHIVRLASQKPIFSGYSLISSWIFRYFAKSHHKADHPVSSRAFAILIVYTVPMLAEWIITSDVTATKIVPRGHRIQFPSKTACSIKILRFYGGPIPNVIVQTGSPCSLLYKEPLLLWVETFQGRITSDGFRAKGELTLTHVTGGDSTTV